MEKSAFPKMDPDGLATPGHTPGGGRKKRPAQFGSYYLARSLMGTDCVETRAVNPD